MEFTNIIVVRKNLSFKQSMFPINFLVNLLQETSLEIPGGEEVSKDLNFLRV